MEHIANIIEEISKIENRANDLIHTAEEEKMKLQKDYEQKIKDFDDALNTKTQKQLDTIAGELKQNVNQELDAQRAITNQLLESLQEQFDKEHSMIADQIVKNMIGA